MKGAYCGRASRLRSNRFEYDAFYEAKLALCDKAAKAAVASSIASV
jgi:hypothetical protein